LSGQRDKFRELRAVFTSRIYVGKLTPEERAEIINEVKEKLRSRASGMVLIGIDDPDAMQEEIDQEAQAANIITPPPPAPGPTGPGVKPPPAPQVDPNLPANAQVPSPLGGIQGGQGQVFGIPYSPGSITDNVVEAFGGVHDSLNQGYFYNPATGNIQTGLSSAQQAVGSVMNWVNVPLAAPLVAASAIGISPAATALVINLATTPSEPMGPFPIAPTNPSPIPIGPQRRFGEEEP